MSLSKSMDMFTETPFGENGGETREASSPVDLDFGIGKLSVSPLQYESTCVEADESSKRMVESDISDTGGLLSAFDSITFAEQPFLSNGLAKGTPQSDDIGYVCEANLHGRRANDCSMIHEPSSHSNAEADEVDEIEKPTKSNDHLIVYTSSRRNTSRNTYAKLDQNNDSKDQPTNCSVIAQNDSLSDLDSLQIARRKRSLISKRAKSSVWRLVPLPSSEQNNKLDPCLANVKKVERVRGGRGKKKAINDKKSVHKSSTPTGRISLKIRIGNQSCGVVNVAEKIVVSEKNMRSSCDIKEIKYREELPGDMLLPNENNSEIVIASDASALGTSLDVTDSVKNKSTKLRCLDPETSPDSEVINSISDAQLCERGIQDMQGSPVMPTEKGVEECFADSIAGVSLGAETRHPCSTFKKACGDSEMNPSLQFSDATEPSVSQADKSVSNGQKKSLKCSRAKDLLPKKGKASRKKGDNSNLLGKPQISSQDNATGDLSRVESHLEAGNQTSPDPVDEVGYVSPHSAQPEFTPSSGQLNSQYVPPRNAWVLCDECEKWRRIAAALADKIDQTNCRWTCKDNADKNFADCSIPQEKSNSEINEELDISDASGDENAGDTLPKSNRNKSTADKPSSWTLIKTNLFLHRRRKTQNIDEVMVCSCKPPSDGRMGCGDECLNRILSIECIKGTCPCGELCSNQKFQKRIYAKLKWLRCGKKGYGLQALQDISQGQFIIEYVGEVLDVHAHAARQREYALQGHKHFYFMSLDRSEVIDACAKGNLGRFINHSCDPNCKTEKWTVNGEICIGLFAIRDIKKGEEVTFDYKYVRVTGAAAKKCVCGSPNCRGYIGDDPKSSDVIVAEDSDDEFAETEMICNDREMYDDRNHIMLQSSLEKENKRKDKLEEEICRVKNLDASDTSIDKLGVKPPSNGCSKASTAARVVEMSIRDKCEPDNSDSSASASAALYAESETSSPLSPTKASFLSDEITLHNELKKSTTTVPGKLQPDGVKSKKKLKIGTMREKDEIDKPDSLSKARDSSPLIRKGKFKSSAVKEKGAMDLEKSNAIRHKSKKLPGFPSDSHVESVEGKLNELLDSEGGISKRKDASRGYLKLLFLTAASGSNGHGEAIQSNRDLSMILDALLKTKSRTVLVDIINKNGLQMLHNIMKRYRKEFIKTPILRKLLKVLEYMAMREILTLEHIAGGPPRPGVESFKDSMLTLTEHADKQVHQIARNFRDRWIPKSLRKTSFTGSDNSNTLFRQHSTYAKSPASSLDHRSDRNGKNADSVESSDKQSSAASGVQTPTVDHSSASNSTNPTNTTRTRKRKSRWDIPMEECKQPKITTADDGKANDHDAPPGFSSPCKTPSNSVSVSADPQERFVSNLPLSYGVPYSIAQQFGAREGEPHPNWTVAPGLPFYPFPPLPPYDKGEKEKPSSTGQDYSGSKRRMVCTSDPPEMNVSKANEHSGFQPEGNLGRKYFRQQKWSHSKIVPPWLRMRNGWGANQFADS